MVLSLSFILSSPPIRHTADFVGLTLTLIPKLHFRVSMNIYESSFAAIFPWYKLLTRSLFAAPPHICPHCLPPTMNPPSSISDTLQNNLSLRLLRNLLQPLNQMQSARRLDHMTQLSRLQRKRRILELLLHVSAAKIAQITHFTGRAAVGLGDGEVSETGLAGADLLLVSEDDGHGFVFGALDLGLESLAEYSGV